MPATNRRFRVYAIIGSVLFINGCDQAPAPVSSVKWPEPPADGEPIASVFDSIVNDDFGDPVPQFRIFNFADNAVISIGVEFTFRDADENEIGKKTWGLSRAPSIVEAKSHSLVMFAGASVPVGTTSAELHLKQANFADGSAYEAIQTGATRRAN
jgi:hypothetical protein